MLCNCQLLLLSPTKGIFDGKVKQVKLQQTYAYTITCAVLIGECLVLLIFQIKIYKQAC